MDLVIFRQETSDLAQSLRTFLPDRSDPRAQVPSHYGEDFSLEDLLPRFVSVAARTQPLPYRPVTLAEHSG